MLVWVVVGLVVGRWERWELGSWFLHTGNGGSEFWRQGLGTGDEWRSKTKRDGLLYGEMEELQLKEEGVKGRRVRTGK